MSVQDNYIELNRHFAEISDTDIEALDVETRSAWGLVSTLSWLDLLQEPRVVILSSAGTGKTWEINYQCRLLSENGKQAYLLRLEDLALEWENSFELGDASSFGAGVESDKEMWVFLDSIDEARLSGPRAFDRALKRLRTHIKENLQNTHIVITSRMGAWRSGDDAMRVGELFPYEPQIGAIQPSDEDGDIPDFDLDEEEVYWPDLGDNEDSKISLIKYYTLLPLTSEQMRMYATGCGVSEANELVSEIERLDMKALAARPRDLDDLISYWSRYGCLGSRTEMLNENLRKKLEEQDPDRAEQDPLSLEMAAAAARKTAAAAVLTQQAKIIVPDSSSSSEGVSVKSILPDWTASDCSALLGRPIFEPETYGFVRFDHRDSKEFLAARWFYGLMENGQSRLRVEQLFFKNQYGIDVVVPSLRPVLPWLATFDQYIRVRLINKWPEILLEGGDPSALPLGDRRQLLEEYCARYATTGQAMQSVDLNTLQRVVTPALSSTIRRLYRTYSENEEIERLLIRSIEIGNLKDLADIAISAAIKPRQELYTRRAAMQAIMAVCDDDQIYFTLKKICRRRSFRSRKAVADVVEIFGPKHLSSKVIVSLLKKVEPKGERFSVDYLSQAVRSYLKTCSVDRVGHVVTETACLLKQEPFVEKRFFEVSQKNAWMLEFALTACERLVREQRPEALCPPCLAILSLTTRVRHYDIEESKTDLAWLVAGWRELNNALFWYDVNDQRQILDGRKGERLTDWWQARIFDGLWEFDADHFTEAIDWIKAKDLLDDKFVALTLAFSLYLGSGRPPAMRRRLWKAVNGNKALSEKLKLLLNPPPMDGDEKRYRRSEAKRKRRQEQQEKDMLAYHADWRNRLPKLLDQIREVEPPPDDHIWNSQRYLFERMRELSGTKNRWSESNWRSLVAEYGQEAAEAIREGLKAIWRRYDPILVSESGESFRRTPIIEAMGLSGLEIESLETPNWPSTLTDDEARRAARYLLSELNGFPSWFREFEQVYPEISLEVISKEVDWDLFENQREGPTHYVVSDIVWHAPWFGKRIASSLLSKLREQEPLHPEPVSRAQTIVMECEEISDNDLSLLCETKLRDGNLPERHLSFWYAVWLSVDPGQAIAHLENALASSDAEVALNLATDFVIALYGHGRERGLNARENHKTPAYLKKLYLLIHQYVRREDDINRAMGGVYSPTRRDDAQDARGRIYSDLIDIPGKEAFDAIVGIASQRASNEEREWLMSHAVARAQSDADVAWSVDGVNEFSTELERTPTNSRELFDVAVNRLRDLKYNYEDGDDSPAQVVIETKDEEILRNYLAGELRRSAHGRYSISQEDEMPDQKRTDIRFEHADISGMVPVELKIADNGWSGRELFYKLKNQLIRDYMRDIDTTNGVYLLVSRGEQLRWRHPGTRKYLNFEETVKALQEYAREIISEESGIENIEVIGIDLTRRVSSK